MIQRKIKPLRHQGCPYNGSRERDKSRPAWPIFMKTIDLGQILGISSRYSSSLRTTFSSNIEEGNLILLKTKTTYFIGHIFKNMLLYALPNNGQVGKVLLDIYHKHVQAAKNA